MEKLLSPLLYVYEAHHVFIYFLIITTNYQLDIIVL